MRMNRRYGVALPLIASLLLLGGARHRAGSAPGWQATALHSSRLTVIAVAERKPNVLYAGDSTGLVYNTHDEGRTFHKGASLHAPIVALSVDPADALAVYVLTTRGLYTSRPAGRWARLASHGLPSLATLHMVYLAPSRTLYAGGVSGLWRSKDGGATFEAVKLERPAKSGQPLDVWAIKADTRRPTRLYAASSAGIYVGGEGGGRWRLDDSPGPLARLAIASRATGGTVYVLSAEGRAMAFSGDGLSDSLTQIDTPIGVVARDLATGAGGRLYAGTQGSGVYVSADQGQHWLQVGDSLPTTTVTEFTQSTLTPSPLIYARTPAGLFSFRDR